MNYRVVHRTIYDYSETIASCHNEARLTPRNFERQTCTTNRLVIEPPPSDYREREDFFGNQVAYFSIQQPHKQLVVQAESEIQVHPTNAQLDYSMDMPWETVRTNLETGIDPVTLDARQYALNSPMVSASRDLEHYALLSFTKKRPIMDAVQNLMQRIHTDFAYDPTFTSIATPLETVLKHRRGVCQDFAQLAIGCLRSLGLSARYISGYVETLPPPGKARLIGADASHAWFSVYIPDYGWLDLDPTNNQKPMDRHITIAWGRDFADVSPLKGVLFGSGEHELTVSVDVEPLNGN
jgi:transglutaminase-like putative cysteine protease